MECKLPDYSFTPSTNLPNMVSWVTYPSKLHIWKCPTAEVDLECGQYWETGVNICLHKK